MGTHPMWSSHLRQSSLSVLRLNPPEARWRSRQRWKRPCGGERSWAARLRRSAHRDGLRWTQSIRAVAGRDTRSAQWRALSARPKHRCRERAVTAVGARDAVRARTAGRAPGRRGRFERLNPPAKAEIRRRTSGARFRPLSGRCRSGQWVELDRTTAPGRCRRTSRLARSPRSQEHREEGAGSSDIAELPSPRAVTFERQVG